MKAIERLYQYFDFKNIKPTRFEKDFNISNGYFGTQLKRNADLGEKIIKNVIDNCLDLNLIWLLTGEGEMLKQSNSEMIKGNNNNNTVVNGHIVSSGTIEKITIEQKEHQILMIEIESLKKENATLKKQIELQDKIIKMLEK